jgi:hypothetical protein
MSKPLLSDFSFVRLSLSESAGDRVKVRGEFAKCGVATENKRIYPKPVWEKEIKRLGKALKERRVFGEIDHPSDGQTKLSRVSHIVTDLSIKDGLVIGEAEIMPTEAGRNLLAILKANVPVGVSSRGFGSVKTNESGNDVVQEDYKLVTFDFVADPADIDAYPQVAESRSLFEGVEFEHDDEQEKAIEFARRIEAEKKVRKSAQTLSPEQEKAAEFARRVESEMAGNGASKDVREELADQILGSISTLRAEVRDEIRAELMNDPEIGKAKAILDSVRDALRPYLLPEDAATVLKAKDAEIRELQKQLAERDLKLKDLEIENASLANMAKEVGYRFYLERMVSNDPDAESIRTLVGDLTKFESSEALKKRVEEVKVELDRKAAEKKAVAEQKNREISEAKAAERKQRETVDAKLAQLEKLMDAERAKREELEDALIEARAENKALATRVYAEERLSNHPKASKLRNLVEATRPASRKEVDDIVDSEREPVRDRDDLQEVRARIRTNMRGGMERTPVELEESAPKGRKSATENYQGLGMNLGDLRRLSGISD